MAKKYACSVCSSNCKTDCIYCEMRDFLELYNKLTEMCFHRCVSNFNNRGLSTDEDACVTGCADRFVKFNQRLMLTFMEFQNAKQEAAIKEMEKAMAEGRTPNIPGLAQEMATRAGDGAVPQGAVPGVSSTDTFNQSPKS